MRTPPLPADYLCQGLQTNLRKTLDTTTARLNGKQIGRQKGASVVTQKSLVAKELILKRSQDFNGTLTDTEMIKLTGIARNTYYKYKRELKKEQEA